MLLSEDVKCLFCGKVFCCVCCREKHENKTHKNEKEAEKKKAQCSKLCSICNNRPLLLEQNVQKDLLQHIFQEHMPLHCKNCLKIYETWDSLQRFSKCLTTCTIPRAEVISTDINANLKNGFFSKDGTTQTSPGLAVNINKAPACILSIHLKVRNKFEDGSSGDSLLSMKNISSIENCSDKLVDRKLMKHSTGTLVRTTSTPMQALLSHTKENVFDSSSYCHVSSIRGSSSESEHSPTPALNTPASSNASVGKEVLNGNLQKIRRRGVSAKMASPLRQIMSKSIQRAIAKHNASEYHEDIMRLNKQKIENKHETDICSPLDLRTTPALRRTQSEDLSHSSSLNKVYVYKRDNKKKEMLCSSQKLTTQSITSITSSTNYEDKSLDTVYTTCRSVEVFTTTEINEIKMKDREKAHDSIFTPKTVGGPFKKIICFDTPSVTHEESSTADEVFYTPNATTAGITGATPTEAVSCNLTRSMSTSDIACGDAKMGRLWSMVTSVIKLPTFRNNAEKNNGTGGSPSLMRRCASFAEDLIHSSLPSEPVSLKRRRNGSDDRSGNVLTISDMEAPPKRIRKIHGRRPIERMLRNK